MSDIQYSSHAKWDCKYHVVLALKIRRKNIFEIKDDTGKILRLFGSGFVLLFLVIFCSSHGFIW